MDQAAKGEAALSASQYDEAVQHYTAALAASPTAVKYYIGRSTAYQRSSKHTEALHDAEVAVVLAHTRAVRELIKESQFRRAIALYHLGQYPDAQFVLSIVKELDPKDKVVPIWDAKLASKLEDVPLDDVARKVTIKKIPEIEVPRAITIPKKATASTETPAGAPKPIAPTPINKIKYDWYQSNESVTINILAKGVSKDATTVDFEKDGLFVSFPVSGSSSDYSYTADPLYASIEPMQSNYRVTPNKVEITLRKAVPGTKWHSLESNRNVAAETPDDNNDPHPAMNPSPAVAAKPDHPSGPVYPTSSKSGPKNWDVVVSEDLDDKDEVEGDETSAFFKKLYSGASEEQQRAMMKSYSESGGTVLSTDWSDVGAKTVVPQPPDGMEAKKYGE